MLKDDEKDIYLELGRPWMLKDGGQLKGNSKHDQVVHFLSYSQYIPSTKWCWVGRGMPNMKVSSLAGYTCSHASLLFTSKNNINWALSRKHPHSGMSTNDFSVNENCVIPGNGRSLTIFNWTKLPVLLVRGSKNTELHTQNSECLYDNNILAWNACSV